MIRRIIADPSATLIAETLLEGSEHAVEGIVRDGELSVLAIFDKPDAGKGPVFPETILVTPSRLDAGTQLELERVARAAIAAIGIVHGPVHVELMAGPDGVAVIEAAGRSIGGLCSRSLSFGLTGTTLETLILRNALGLDKPELRRERVASGVLMIPIPEPGRLVSVGGIEETRAIPGVTGIDISVPIGGRIAPTPEGDRYLGFVYARAGDPADVERALRTAMATLRVEVEPVSTST
jgi:biotin carboxylase